MELEVGMYVRTKYGISKIEEIKEDKTHKTNWCTVDKAQYHSFLVREQEIIKARHKIINLIEEGDYVNGEYVWKESDKLVIGDTDNPMDINEEDIKSIVTKEQFESMSYKMEE